MSIDSNFEGEGPVGDRDPTPSSSESQKDQETFVSAANESDKKTQNVFQEKTRKTHPVGAPEPKRWLPKTSMRLPTLGIPNEGLLVLAINGMNTPIGEAFSHQAYLRDLALDQLPIDFIYNHSNHIAVDLLEVFTLNYQGVSPYTAKLLQESWQQFADQNADHPNRKILLPCHSQGTIHVYNALLNSPEDLRNRVIVITIAPAKIIPKSLCHMSFNYASKLDIVHYGELLRTGFFEMRECGISRRLENLLESRSELILLDPHPDAKGIDHDFESPTFRKYLTEHLQTYIASHGEYPLS